MVRDGGYDVVHCHGSWDHFLCAWALGRKREVPLIRSDHSGREYGSNPLHKWFYGPRMSDRLLVISDRFRTQAVDRAGRTAETVVTVRGAVDTRQYEPEAPPPNTRSQYGLAEADFVIGIVARVQPHRHWDELLEAARIVQQQKPRIKIVVLGRGTRKKRLLDDPVKDLGLQDTVFPLGYLREGYIDALNMFDSGMLLVPGSDGTCRAAMEMAALQKPMLVGRAGVLPEIVVDGRTGIVVPHSGQKLAEAMMTLAEMPVAERLAWGRAGRERLEKWFCLERQVETVIGVYTDLVG
jgi:glycosyltransferase involved in cell wall biosynthesis